MNKIYEKPDLEQIKFQPLETITASVAGLAKFGFFDEDDMRRRNSE